MHEHGLARELWPQLQKIAEEKQLKRVTRVEMIVGLLHGVAADFLSHSFEHAFEGTNFEGAETEIRIIEPAEQYTEPGDDTPKTADGWELIVTTMDGE